MGVPLRLVSLPDKAHSIASFFKTTNLKHLKHNGQGFRIKEGQEERLQRFCSLLPEANPGVQGSFRYHGRRQRRSFVFLRHCRRLQLFGKSVSDGEAQGMLSEAPGPVNFTQMVMLFAEKMAGGADDDDTILKAFDAFEVNGKIDA